MSHKTRLRGGGWGAERGMTFPTLHPFRFSLLECYLACHLDPVEYSINQLGKERHGSTFFLRRHSAGGTGMPFPRHIHFPLFQA